MRRYAHIVLVLAVLAAASGCSTQSGGSRWYAPATWFSHAPAAGVDAAATREAAAREAVIKAAQKSSHETSFALAAAPASRPVAVAVDTNATTVALLDQAAGPLDAATLTRLRSVVVGLLSDNAELRAAAEVQRAKDQRSISEVSTALARAEEKSEAAAGKLRAAFERENALANDLRAQRALLWLAAGVAALLAAGWIYAQLAFGGLPMAAGKLMRDLRSSKPEIAAVVEPMFDTYLNRHEQAQISKHAT